MAVVHRQTLGNALLLEVDADPSGSITAPRGSLAVDSSSGDVWRNIDGSTDWIEMVGPLWRGVAGGDQLDASSMASAEVAHSSTLTPPTGLLNAVRRLLRLRAHWKVDAAVGSDTWEFRIRLGGLSGQLVTVLSSHDIAASEVVNVRQDLTVITAGASGVVEGTGLFTESQSFASYVTGGTSGTFDLSSSFAITPTGQCSTTNVNQVTLQRLEAEIWAA